MYNIVWDTKGLIELITLIKNGKYIAVLKCVSF